ncbi:MAG: pyruvate synthase, partial [Candidatus Electrothrix sp. ATG2]|nr:pyruvate synthase [Candidatus Electrothrix sp. ATG2]
EITAEFADEFERSREAVECYRTEDAEYLFVQIGSFATKAREAVDRLREAGQAVGLVRPRLFRPLPEQHLCQAMAGKKGVAVIDQNLGAGKGGVLYSELASVLFGHADMPAILVSFIGGLGGRDISTEEYFAMAAITRQAVQDGKAPPPRLLFTETELREVRKLQAVANMKRRQGGEKS